MTDANQILSTPEAKAGIAAVPVLMKFQTCDVCGVTHAVPGVLLAAIATAGGQLHCPSGHATQLSARRVAASLTALTAAALAMMQNQSAELARLRREAVRNAVATGEPVPGADDMKRRYGWLASRAERVPGEGLSCLFCAGVPKNSAALRRHLRHNHADRVKALPASTFQ